MAETGASPIIVWLRRDLRLADNPALAAAAESGRPVIPLYIHDETPEIRPIGAASAWWLGRSLEALSASVEQLGSRLIVRRGVAAEVLQQLVAETGAAGVFWNRLYDPGVVERDMKLKASLRAQVHSFNAALLNEPWELQTSTGKPFSVFTPYWRAARTRLGEVKVLPVLRTLLAPRRWPQSETLTAKEPYWSAGFRDWTPGETGAQQRLAAFVERGLDSYAENRDRPDLDATSRLSPHLHFGEIGPRQVWLAAHGAEARDSEIDKSLAELGWREFNHHVLFHHPTLPTQNLRGLDGMAWRDDPESFRAWTQGRTGYPLVDAGMRELWATGFMHNRVRMVAASFLVKHLLIDWREGERWFWDTLVDADAANNAANWQWVAGSGADASPWFRIFNPTIQAKKFDPDGVYIRRWLPEYGQNGYPAPIVEHGLARRRALAALEGL